MDNIWIAMDKSGDVYLFAQENAPICVDGVFQMDDKCSDMDVAPIINPEMVPGLTYENSPKQVKGFIF